MLKTKEKEIKKILLLGSGALKIGEAGEFDYSGSQAIKALKEEGVQIILINPNIATYQTSKGMADKVYFLPVTPHFVTKVIEKEKPEAILLSFGGQTALNCGLELEKSKILKKHHVKVLGTPTKSIELTEDRELFAKVLRRINLKTPRSVACRNIKRATVAAQTIGYPVIVRAAFALGGKGSGFACNEMELKKLLEISFSYSPQVLVEEDLRGWKEVEYEVVRDKNNNCITVCNMENVDPLGIHTGESIVVAPSQTLSNHEYNYLRTIAIKTIQELKIVGECNIQYALNPETSDYRIIEVNARLSRSSALASKATGYPLAYVAAKLALGFTLPELKNSITKITSAFFEPALDYITIKIPRWDLAKFKQADNKISSEMKSVGEIMAIGRSFEEALQKGLRMLNIGAWGFCNENFKSKNLKHEIEVATPKRIFAIAEAFEKEWEVEEINELTGIDPWFLSKMENIITLKKELRKMEDELNASIEGKDKAAKRLIIAAKQAGFTDFQIGNEINLDPEEIRKYRHNQKIVPYTKQIDTLAAEFPAKTNYLYQTYHGIESDIGIGKKKKMMVLGGGPYCIGSSVEFDWCCINVLESLKKAGYETIMLNCNPETVSTDYDMCDRLYFDELSLERVRDIYEFEKPEGVVVATGGQVPNNLALKLEKHNIKIVGTSASTIDKCEDRNKFSALLDTLEIDQPKWRELKKVSDAKKFAEQVGYPVLVRPSYVLSGAAMRVAHDSKSLIDFLTKAAEVSKDKPVVISKFEKNAKEIEIDAVAHEGKLLIYAIAEHIENAGVHSGDATIVLPPQKLYLETIRRVKVITKKIAKSLKISGPFNIQFLARNNEIKVIECNLRASRSFPFSSKVTGYNFIEIATASMIRDQKALRKIKNAGYKTLEMDHIGIKAPHFSFSRLKGADPILGVEMASTGEVATFGQDLHETLLKSLMSVGFILPKKNILLAIGGLEAKVELLPEVKKLDQKGYHLFATEGTAEFLKDAGIKVKKLEKVSSKKSPNISEYLRQKKIDLVFNLPSTFNRDELSDGYYIRRVTIDTNTPLITNMQLMQHVINAITKYTIDDLEIEPWSFYETK
jgi:carbamoyl-phosphate synthase large subunit